MAVFVARVLASTEDTWATIFSESGQQYQPAGFIFYDGRGQSGCGAAQAAAAPGALPRGRFFGAKEVQCYCAGAVAAGSPAALRELYVEHLRAPQQAAQVVGKSYSTDPQNYRRIAHIVSDAIYESLAGETAWGGEAPFRNCTSVTRVKARIPASSVVVVTVR